ncbi:MAG: competence/damage-inducible protein A [Acidobacteriia bacterium]|nr:competence/damage-inducible protein A [Terriglobia bacterium]
MNAEIVAVGSEMLTPERVDTNSLFLTAELNNLGIEVVAKYVVGDHLERLAGVVRLALSRSGIVILSGGLGPTEDDLTRDGVAAALDRKLVYHPEIAEALEQRFARLNRKMAEVNKRQAFVIEGADILPNDRGTASGQWIEDSNSIVMLLPGPPHELKAMFERQCVPRLARAAPKQVIRTVELRVAGMGESDLDQLIAPVYKKYQNPATTILAGAGDIQIHFRAQCDSEEQAMAMLAEVASPVELLLGDRVYSRNGDSIEAVVGSLLRQHHATVSVAESCTGGLLGERFTSTSGSSDYFVGGFITYSNGLKTALLAVPPDLIAEHGAVSKLVAEAMAAGARRCTGSTYALSITGVAGPEGGTESKPVGTTFIGLAGPAGVEVVQRQFLGDRARIRAFASQIALDLLRRKLMARVA